MKPAQQLFFHAIPAIVALLVVAAPLDESKAGGGSLTLLRWRDGKREKVVLKLPLLGSYSTTAPYDCPKSERILQQGCEALAKRVADPSYRQNPITRSLNALALLASGNPEYLPIVRKEAQWAAGFSADSFQTWHYGYVIMLLSEYVMATGDDSVLPGLRRLALEAANGQSIVGSWGHKFADTDGRLMGYGAHGKRVIPQLQETANYFEYEETDFPHKMSLDKARIVRETIKEIEASDDSPKLIHLSTP